MLHSILFSNFYHISITAVSTIPVSGGTNRRFPHFTTRSFLNKSSPSPSKAVDKPPVVLDSLRLLEWDKLCDSVSSFAGTSVGKETTKEKLWSLNQTYEESLKLLDETKAAVEMHKYGCGMDFSGIDVVLIILDMERLKQSLQEHVDEAQAYLKRARDLHETLLAAERKVVEYGSDQRFQKIGQITEMGAIARSLMHKKVRQIRASSTQPSQRTVENYKLKPTKHGQQTEEDNGKPPEGMTVAISSDSARKSALEKPIKLPKVGDSVRINSLNKEATILKVEPSKEEVLVQAGMMKLKLKLADIAT